MMDLTLWDCPSGTLWGRQQDWLCRRSRQWGWRATNCPSRCAWPWSSLKIHHLRRQAKLIDLEFSLWLSLTWNYSASKSGKESHHWDMGKVTYLGVVGELYDISRNNTKTTNLHPLNGWRPQDLKKNHNLYFGCERSQIPGMYYDYKNLLAWGPERWR